MIRYEVKLKDQDLPMPIEAQKFNCEDTGHTVFYARPAPTEHFEEVARILTKNIKHIEETTCQ